MFTVNISTKNERRSGQAMANVARKLFFTTMYMSNLEVFQVVVIVCFFRS